VGIIEDLTYLPTEKLGAFLAEKDVVFDIYCTNQQKEHFIIEMQRGRQHHYANRVITYVSRVVSYNVKRGDVRYNIPNIYSFNILDFDADEFRQRDRFLWKIQLKDDDNEIFSKKITLFFVELTKFAHQIQEKDLCGNMQQWLYLLKNINKLKETSLLHSHPSFARLYELCNYSKLNAMEKQEYEKSILEYEGVKDAVECAREDGERDGFEKGIEEGIERGIEKGREEGISKSKIQIAQNMLEKGFDILTIVSITGLTENEISEIR